MSANLMSEAADADTEQIRIFIGADENQALPAAVLAHTIRRHSSRPVQIQSLADAALPVPHRLEVRTRTGFTFSRFLIPELCGRSGRAIYLDADMLVFRDISEVWDAPVPSGVSLLYTRQPEKGRRARYAVMTLDCGALDWDLAQIVADLDAGRVNYEALVYDFALVRSDAKTDALPETWNSLDAYREGETALLHYTAMPTQPWIYPYHPLGQLWYSALKDGLQTGTIEKEQILEEILKGHVSPNLPRWAGLELSVPREYRRGWLPPYLMRVATSRRDLSWRITCAVRRRTTWTTWYRRLVTRWPPA